MGKPRMPGRSTLSTKARRHLKEACERCGTTEKPHAHHIDRDPTNNVASNIATLCRSCHAKVHWTEHRDEMMAGRTPAKPRIPRRKGASIPEHVPHGITRYTYGCRCPVCTAAERVYKAGQRQTYNARLEAGAEVKHGTRSTYNNYGCRCDPCRTAKRETRDDYRDGPSGDLPHGTVHGYNRWKCRCDRCREAGSGARQERRRRARAKAGAC